MMVISMIFNDWLMATQRLLTVSHGALTTNSPARHWGLPRLPRSLRANHDDDDDGDGDGDGDDGDDDDDGVENESDFLGSD